MGRGALSGITGVSGDNLVSNSCKIEPAAPSTSAAGTQKDPTPPAHYNLSISLQIDQVVRELRLFFLLGLGRD